MSGPTSSTDPNPPDVTNPEDLKRMLKAKGSNLMEDARANDLDQIMTFLNQKGFPSFDTLTRVDEDMISALLRLQIRIVFNEAADKWINEKTDWEDLHKGKKITIKDGYVSMLQDIRKSRPELNVSKNGKGREELSEILNGSPAAPKKKYIIRFWKNQ